MDRLEAKEILLLYRPGTSDQDDPDFAPALELAKRDPELSGWFEQHCAFQKALRAKFEQIPVPEGLKEQILSERKAHTAFAFQRKAALLAVAAAVVLLLFGIGRLYLAPREDNSFSLFRARMASTVLRAYPAMDLETNDLSQIRNYLAQHGALGDYSLPGGLAQTTATGCKILPWHGKTVSMVCFSSTRSGLPSGPDLFLFIVNRDSLANAPSREAPEFNRISRLTTASWSSGDKTYILGGMGGEEFVRKFL